MSRDLDKLPSQRREEAKQAAEQQREAFLADLRAALRHGPSVRVIQAWLASFGTVAAPVPELVQTGYNMGRASAGSTIRNDIGDACEALNFASMLDQLQKGKIHV
jgi:hypothetical protein